MSMIIWKVLTLQNESKYDIINNKLTIEVERVPKRLQPIIKKNRLLKIEDGHIHFRYEKSQMEKK